MRIVLVNPPVRTYAPPDNYPIGLCYVASYLQEHGHKVRILDVNGYRWSKSVFQEVFSHVDCDAVGIGGLVQTFNNVQWIAHFVKSVDPDLPVFAGNTVASTIPQILLKHTDVDVAVIGEGEETALELVEVLEKGSPLADVRGIVYKDKGDGIIENPLRKPIENLDLLPLPSWIDIPMEVYLNGMKALYGLRNATISTVRGCPFNCRFCCKNYIGYKVRSRSPENIIEELKVWIAKYKIEGFIPNDDLFIYDRKRVMRFCDLLIREGLDYLRWTSQARVDLVTEEIILKMKRAGCMALGFGFESHSQRVLDYYNKGITVQQQQKAIDVCKKTGMFMTRYYIVGARNETEQTLKECYDFCKRNKLSYRPQNFLQPQPQTPIFTECLERGIIKDEYQYIQKLSNIGDAGTFVVNVTESLSDEKLQSLFHKYNNSSLLPYQVVDILKDLDWTISRVRKRGLKGTMKELLKIVKRTDIRNLKRSTDRPKREAWL